MDTMRVKRLLLTAVLCVSSLILQAQSLEVSERWLMNERLLDLVDSYERFSTLEGRSDAYSFLALFRTPDVPVWCDYIASKSFGTTIPAKEYVAYSKSLEDRSLKISRLRKGPLSYRDGRWRASVEFNKQVEYEDSLGFTFSTRSDMVGGDYRIVLNCVWMQEDEEFRIESIDGYESPASYFPKGNFHIVERKNEIDSEVLYGDEPLDFNEYGFAIVPEGKEFAFDDDDVMLQTISEPGADRYDILSFNTKYKRFRARIHGAYSPNYSVGTSDYINKKNWGGQFGGEVGYSLFGGRSTKFVVYAGIGVSYSDISFSLKDDSQISYNVLDQSFRISAASEGLKVLDISVLLPMLSMEHNFSSMVCGVWDIVGVNWNMTAKMFQGAYSVTYAMNNGEEQTREFDSFLNPNRNEVNPWCMSVFSKAGIDIAFAPCKYIYVRGGYEMSFFPNAGYTYNPSNKVEWYSANDHIYPLVSWPGASGQQEALAVHSFLNNISLRRAGFIAELGLKLKF